MRCVLYSRRWQRHARLARWESGLLAKASTQHIHKTLNKDLARHLRFANPAVQEDDRRLNDLVSLLQDPIRHLDLEGIALRLHCIQIDVLQHLTPVTAVSRC